MQHKCIQDYVMHTKKILHAKFLSKMLLKYKNQLRVEKKQKKIGQFQNYLKRFFVSTSKKAGHTVSKHGNCMISVYKKNLGFFNTRLFYWNQTATEFSLFFQPFFEFARKLYDQHFLTIIYAIRK